MKYTVELVHKTSLRIGDVIRHAGRDHTLCEKDFRTDPLMGICVLGDSHKSGHELVQRLNIFRAKPEVVHG